jgi:predicted DNA-binding protein
MAQLSIGMPKRMVDDLKAVAAREDRPVAYVVRQAVEVYLNHFAATSTRARK